MHQSSMQAVAGFVATHLAEHRGRPLRVLDLGSMDVNGSYRQLFDDPAWTYTGVDVEAGAGVDVVLPEPYDWRRLGSRSFDVIVSGQAFEHIRFPWVTVLEVARLLRPGGLVCVVAPSSGYEHRYPVDCWRYYPDGMAALASWADLELLEARTDWEPRDDHPDDSSLWKDTVLVARRPALAGRHALQNALKQAALRAVLRRHADRQERRTVLVGEPELPLLTPARGPSAP